MRIMGRGPSVKAHSRAIDELPIPWDETHMREPPQDLTEIKRLVQACLDAGVNKKDLSKKLGLHDSFVSELMRGKVKALTHPTAKKLADFFGLRVDDLLTVTAPYSSREGVTAAHPPARDGARIIELDVRRLKGARAMDEENGALAVGEWEIPTKVISPQTLTETQRLKIIQVLGDSMKPDFLPGERVLVDTIDRLPDPPGVFAIWTGHAVRLIRLELVPYSEPPTVRLVAGHKDYEARELPLEAVIVNGRVIGKWLWT